MGAELPRELVAALEMDLSEFPAPSQMDDLANRLAPRLETATAAAAAAIPAGLLAPKAPLSLAATLKLLAVKWGHTVIVPMAIGAVSGGVVWEVREATRSSEAAASVSARITDEHRSAAPSRGKTARHEMPAPGEAVEEEPQAVGAVADLVAPQALAVAATPPARIAVAPPPVEMERAPAVTIAPDLTEIELIDRAQRALARQPAVARQWVDEHTRRFPAGTFVQEREAVAIEALVREGRMVEARARAVQFRTRFPESAYLRRIEAWLRGPRTQESESN
jgi:hypothetical protein